MDRLAWWHRWLGFATVWLHRRPRRFTTLPATRSRRRLARRRDDHDRRHVPVRPVVGRRVRPVRRSSGSPRSGRPAAACRTRPGSGSTCTPTSRSPSASFHQLFTGADFIHDPIAVGYWIGLYVVAALLIVVFRFGQPAWTSWRHRLRVSASCPRRPAPSRSTSPAATSTASRSAPASTSCSGSSPATAGGAGIRSRSARRRTATGSGSRSRRWATTAPGSRRCRPARRVFVEGPYGVLTGARRTRPKVTLIAGGIGIAPLRALLESLPAQPRRPDPRLPGEPPARPRVPATSSTCSPSTAARASTTSSVTAAAGTTPTPPATRWAPTPSAASSRTSRPTTSSCADRRA